MDTNSEQKQRQAIILDNQRIQNDYFRVVFQVADIPALAEPGQFVHLKLPGMDHRILRRPFSICDVEAASNQLVLVYKVVGEGSQRLSQLKPGESVDMLGPLGRGFSPLPANGVLVAGGYGCAATYLLAKRSKEKPLVILGARSQADILLQKAYEQLGCRVEISTDDGSLGYKGRVTELLAQVARPGVPYYLAACGPIPMLKALAQMMKERQWHGELSMDKAMCCGVGACFACVTKVVDATEQGWRYARVCKEGPVFPAERLVWD